jgi:hypothetical protein
MNTTLKNMWDWTAFEQQRKYTARLKPNSIPTQTWGNSATIINPVSLWAMACG